MKKFLFYIMLGMMINIIVTFIINREMILLPLGKLFIYFQLVCIVIIGGYVGMAKKPKQ
jgi:hypothetical protein